MSDFQAYKSKRIKKLDAFKDYQQGYENFKIGAMLKYAREEAGLSQDDLAFQLGTKKSAISRIENHAEDIKLSTLEKFAEALGKKIMIKLA